MNFCIASLALMLTLFDVVKGCHTPVVAQRGPRGPPGAPGPAGSTAMPYTASVQVTNAKKKRSIEGPQTSIKFPIENDAELPQANVIVEKTLTKLFKNVEYGEEVFNPKSIRPLYSFEEGQLMAEITVTFKDSTKCYNLITKLAEQKDEKLSIKCL